MLQSACLSVITCQFKTSLSVLLAYVLGNMHSDSVRVSYVSVNIWRVNYIVPDAGVGVEHDRMS